MRIFEHFNTNTNCYICNKNDDKPAVLIPIDGTEKDGNVECEQVHLDCIDLHLIKLPKAAADIMKGVKAIMIQNINK